MSGKRSKLGRFVSVGVLLVLLGGIVLAYLGTTMNLSDAVYTQEQSSFLEYNYSRSLVQAPPTINTVQAGGTAVPATLSEWESRVQVVLDARYEGADGVNATVYDLDFEGIYHMAYPGPAPTATVALLFPFPANLETLHDVEFLVDGAAPPTARYGVNGIQWERVMEVGEAHDLVIRYRADGANSFGYSLNRDRRFDELDLSIAVSGVAGSEVPQYALPPTDVEQDGEGERFVWEYAGLVPGRNVELSLPQRLGFAQRVTQLRGRFQGLAVSAPFLVGLFTLSLAGFFFLAGTRMPLEGYLLSALGMLLFYPLLTFASALVGIFPASLVALLLSGGMVIVFLGLLLGWSQTWRAGWLLVIFLGFFSLGQLSSWPGLVLTLGALLLVGTFVAVYPGWIAARRAEEAAEPPEEVATTPEPEADSRYCPRCSRPLEPEQAFCPGCGYDVRYFRRCPGCHHEQFIPGDVAVAYCVRCGATIGTPPGGKK